LTLIFTQVYKLLLSEGHSLRVSNEFNWKDYQHTELFSDHIYFFKKDKMSCKE
jgi:hypothetical protein